VARSDQDQVVRDLLDDRQVSRDRRPGVLSWVSPADHHDVVVRQAQGGPHPGDLVSRGWTESLVDRRRDDADPALGSSPIAADTVITCRARRAPDSTVRA
jgi:hypothetical protein